MNELMHVQLFTDFYNECKLYTPININVPNYKSDITRSIEVQFSLKQRTHIGISELGKPAVLLALKKLGYKDREPLLRNIFRCHLGDVFESLLLESLTWYFREILSVDYIMSFQDIVNFKGYEGHLDCVLNNQLIVEVKTMNSYYWSKFVKQPNDDKGYITQLALYSEAFGIPAVWLCLNIETYELRLVSLSDVPDELIQDKINRSVAVINALENITNFSELFETLAAPQPETEFFRKQPTGKFLVPESMRYTDFASVFYVIKEENNGYKKPTKYVEDYADYEYARKQLDFLSEVPFQ